MKVYVVVLDGEGGTQVWARAREEDAQRLVRYLEVQHSEDVADLGAVFYREVDVD